MSKRGENVVLFLIFLLLAIIAGNRLLIVLNRDCHCYNITTMERSCVNCDLRMKEYKKISDKQLKYHLSRFEFMKKYGLIDTMIIDTIH